MDDIEIDIGSATDKRTGARIWMDLMPREMASVDYWYESPNFSVKIGFSVKHIYEEIQFEVDGTSRSLRGEVEEKMLDMLARDFYRLLTAFHTRHLAGRTDSQFRLYAAEASTYGGLPFEVHEALVRSVPLKALT